MKSYWVDSLTGGDSHALFVEHFRLRKRVFIDGLNWRLNTRDDQEFDQYDTPFASYCLVSDNDRLVAGARILPTNIEVGPNTYMIRDAALGRLGSGLPPTICEGFAPPVCPNIWEATRLIVDPTLPKETKKEALRITIDRLVAEARKAGVEKLLAIGGVELALGVKISGHAIERLTPYHSTESGGIAIFQMPIFHL
ncbi:hypothetical protein LCM27_01940 [Ruegeria marisrubri]|uniref:acyl-homoserine-lactone synthase n=1 Tax=Ruegeria marisrubri TaxID=1685379 RepID=UPI001CD6E58E|nr:acyl-homoserine-lactone synthase [Ruegeria marisrubri]MCA0905153.1 hypothetical protein [Ruegeria marisrubri]